MKTVLTILAITLLAACSKPAETSTAVGTEFVVDKLFTHEGCTVYRFSDGGNKRYYTNCQGSTSWQEQCGKNCTRQNGIN
jgi:outer membrane biogenesis lipoprotein LolB